MSDEIPQWARDRACELANKEPWRPAIAAFARYIAQHEQPPVDPDLETAREICARVAEEVSPSERGVHAGYRGGDYDDDPEVQFALSALKEARNG